jgi:hypothetical protein
MAGTGAKCIGNCCRVQGAAQREHTHRANGAGRGRPHPAVNRCSNKLRSQQARTSYFDCCCSSLHKRTLPGTHVSVHSSEQSTSHRNPAAQPCATLLAERAKANLSLHSTCYFWPSPASGSTCPKSFLLPTPPVSSASAPQTQPPDTTPKHRVSWQRACSHGSVHKTYRKRQEGAQLAGGLGVRSQTQASRQPGHRPSHRPRPCNHTPPHCAHAATTAKQLQHGSK